MELRRYTDPEHLDYLGTSYDPLSFDRPEPICHIPEAEQVTDPLEGRAACHVASAEWRLLGWLEREGFDYDLYADVQLHSGALDLDAYRVVILGPHPEYWSRRMYQAVKAWVFERGGRLVYFGGNGINCEVDLIDGHTCVYLNEDARALRDPVREFESRFHQRGESEASLLGVVYDDRGIMTAAPYRVVDGSSWVFAGTGLREGDLFGHRSQHERVPGGASGHETDKRSKSSPAGTHLLAKGTNPQDGGAEMVIHQPPSGGRVFSAGSISFTSSLLVDEDVSAVAGNVLRCFLE
jgi:hypothetical protein